MTDTDLVERVRQYDLFLNLHLLRVRTIIETEQRQSYPNTFSQEGARRLAEACGQRTAYQSAQRELQIRFPELYTPDNTR